MTQCKIAALTKVSLLLAALCLHQPDLRAAPFSFFVEGGLPNTPAVRASVKSAETRAAKPQSNSVFGDV